MGINFRSSFPEPKIPFGTVVFGLLYKYSDFYFCLGGKYYYQIGQIKRLLTDHLIKSTDDRRQDLIDHHRQNSTKKK